PARGLRGHAGRAAGSGPAPPGARRGGRPAVDRRVLPRVHRVRRPPGRRAARGRAGGAGPVVPARARPPARAAGRARRRRRGRRAAAAPGLAPPVATAIAQAAAGNPLALVELTAALNTDQRTGAAPLDLPLTPGR